MSRLNWQQRHGPDEFDNSAPEAESLEFDYTHQGGANPWPLKHGSIKFGPALIRRAWASGLFVYAEVEGFPHPVVAKELQWCEGNVLELRTAEGIVIPKRLFTRPTAAGCTVGGVLIE
jgi:hypothetical protein